METFAYFCSMERQIFYYKRILLIYSVIEYNAGNRKDVGNFDEVLNSLYGEPDSPQRDEFRRKACAYCVAML